MRERQAPLSRALPTETPLRELTANWYRQASGPIADSEGFLPPPRGSHSNVDYGKDHVAGIRHRMRLRALRFPPAAIEMFVGAGEVRPSWSQGVTLIITPRTRTKIRRPARRCKSYHVQILGPYFRMRLALQLGVQLSFQPKAKTSLPAELDEHSNSVKPSVQPSLQPTQPSLPVQPKCPVSTHNFPVPTIGRTPGAFASS
jgi:hypothetical protein